MTPYFHRMSPYMLKSVLNVPLYTDVTPLPYQSIGRIALLAIPCVSQALSLRGQAHYNNIPFLLFL